MVHFLLQNAQTTEAVEEIAEVVSKTANEGLMGQALQITLIGMAILFVSLFILWGVMELLVRLVKGGPKEEEEEEASDIVETAEAGDEMKLKAAAAAAAYVIAKK